MTMQVATGFVNGTGAAINVELGWVPDTVILHNWTDGTPITIGVFGAVIAFTGGGTTELKAGDTIRGLTNTGVYGKVKQVILDSGSWAGGDAAGFLIFDVEDLVGTFGSENAEINDSGTDDLTVAAQVEKGLAIAAAAAAATGDAALSSYVGSQASNSKGFTIGSTVSVDGKLLHYTAIRNR